MNVEVKVSGMGGCFDDVYLIIKDALEKRGMTVTVENKHPGQCSTLAEWDEWRVTREQDLEEAYAKVGKKYEAPESKVHITVDHRPWGG